MVNILITLLHYIHLFFNFHELVLSINKALYLLKQPLVGTLQK